MKKYNSFLVKQTDQSDCGVACLSMILKHFGNQDHTIEQLRNNSGTTSRGTTLLGLLQAGKRLGLDSNGFEADIASLKTLTDPVILHVIKEGNQQHYVVLLAYEKQQFVVADPAEGILSYDLDQLQAIWKSRALLKCVPSEHFEVNTATHKKKNWIWNLIKPESSLLMIVTFLGIAMTMLSLSTALYSQKLIDVILPDKDTFKLIMGISLLVVLLLFKGLIQFIRNRMLIQQHRRFNVRVIGRFFDLLLFLPKTFFDHRKTGDLIARMNDTAKIQNTISLIVSSVIIDLLLVLVSTVFVFLYDPWLGAMVLIGVMLLSGLSWLFNNDILYSQRAVMKAYAHNESNYVDVIQGVDTIKAMAKERDFRTMTSAIYQHYQDENYKLGKLGSRFQLFNDWIATLFSITLIAYLSVQVVNGALLVGEMVALLSVSSGIFPAVVNIFMTNIKLKEAKVAFDRMFEYAGLAPEVSDQADSSTQSKTERINLKFEKVSFAFPGTNRLIENIDLSISKGRVTALLGESGGGKSTLFQLALRFYTPQSGVIRFNGMDIADTPLFEWRSSLGMVAQEVKMFNGSIIDNIVVGNYDKGVNDVIHFCETWGFKVFFDKFSNGYATLAGEDGINLSGGQQQLVALARVLYHKPKILLLDEAFSAMGSEMKSFALDLIHQKCNDMAVLIATHEMATALRADHICILRNGEITDSGSPQDLLTQENILSQAYDQITNFSRQKVLLL